MMSNSTHFYAQRLKVIQQQIEPGEAYLISKATDITHFTGFPQLVPEEREAFLCLTQQQAFLFHHSFSPTLSNFSELTYIPETSLNKIHLTLQQEKITTLYLDEKTLFADEFKFLSQFFSDEKLKKIEPQLILKSRLIKDELALAHQQTAGQIIAQVFDQLPQLLAVGLTEKQLTGKIVGLMMELGAESPAFPTIVAFGANGALPHHQPTDRKLLPNEAVLIDAGAKVNGYRSDMTRTLWFGNKPTPEFLKIEQIVKTAYDQATAIIQNGPQTHLVKDIDDAARNYITQQGYGNEFIHTTGHGIGLEIHEYPSVSWFTKEPIEPNTTITIEPGIYLVGQFGYRFENTVYITDNSYQVLTQL
ncbi:MAG: M24 family metallopeptidase [Candidatus Pacebacteria bacterium]|nr:M24 family metallopeptidase [Candidatus Paceibacterota bacterium]